MPRMFLPVILFICFASPSACLSQSTTPRPIVVSILQLIATPEKFDGKPVEVIGFLGLDNEADLIYLSKEDYENVVLMNAIWVDKTEDMRKISEHLNLKYVRIEGTFQSDHEKRDGLSIGGIKDIKTCTFHSDPAHPLIERIKNAMHP